MKIKDIVEGEVTSKGKSWLARQGEKLGKFVGDFAQGEAGKVRKHFAPPRYHNFTPDEWEDVGYRTGFADLLDQPSKETSSPTQRGGYGSRSIQADAPLLPLTPEVEPVKPVTKGSKQTVGSTQTVKPRRVKSPPTGSTGSKERSSQIPNRVDEMRITDIIRTVLDIVDQAEQPAQEPMVAIAVSEPDQETMDMQALAGILKVGDDGACDGCGRDPCGCDDAGYANEPKEIIAPMQAAFPSGTDLNRQKQQNPVGGFTGDNPMARN